MAEMDLIPEDYRHNLRLSRWIRNFIIACVVVIIGVALAKSWLAYQIWRENVQMVRLEQQRMVFDQNKSKVNEYQQQKLVTEQQLAELDKLRSRDQVKRFLYAIDRAYTDNVWFENIHFFRHQSSTSLGSPNAGVTVVPNGAEALQVLQLKLGAEIIGNALNHTLLAEFMRRLGAQHSIADLRLLDTSTKTFANTQVVNFSLALDVNEKGLQP